MEKQPTNNPSNCATIWAEVENSLLTWNLIMQIMYTTRNTIGMILLLKANLENGLDSVPRKLNLKLSMM
jgi:hypothetical protein